MRLDGIGMVLPNTAEHSPALNEGVYTMAEVARILGRGSYPSIDAPTALLGKYGTDSAKFSHQPSGWLFPLKI